MKQNTQDQYPLYDIPWLVRDPNDFRMSQQRHNVELFNQTVVDEYFTLRAKGIMANNAKKQAAEKHGKNTIFWKNFHFLRNTKVGFDSIFAPSFDLSSSEGGLFILRLSRP